MKNEKETWAVLLSHNETFNAHNIIPKTVQQKLKMTRIWHKFEYQIVYNVMEVVRAAYLCHVS